MVGLWPTCNSKPWREGCRLPVVLKLASHRTGDGILRIFCPRHRACICFNAMMASYNRALDCCCKGLQNRLLARCHQLALPAACSPQSGPTKYNKVAEHNKGNIKTKWTNTTKETLKRTQQIKIKWLNTTKYNKVAQRTKYTKVAEHNKGCATLKSNSLGWGAGNKKQG